MEQKNDQKYYIPDIESGNICEVSKEEHEAYKEFVESFRPKFKTSIDYGKIFVFGTKGETDSNHMSFEELWNEQRTNN